jgi:Ca-activated chloride channel family protein
MVLEYSYYFYALVAIPLVLLLFFVHFFWQRKQQRKFASSGLMSQLAPNYSVFKMVLKLVFVLLAITAMTFALVNPKIGSKMETVKREGIDIVFAVDVSRSMLAEDIAPNRLEKSKQLVSQIINQLGSDRIGIVAYAGSAFPVLPITTDYGVAKMFLQSMNTEMLSSQGTALDDAIHLSLDYFDENTTTNKLVIMLSDGEDHSEGLNEALSAANDANLKILTIGIGSPNGGPIPIRRNGVVERFLRDKNDEVVLTKLDEETLKIIGKETQGGYVYGGNTKDVLDYVKKVLDNIEKTEFETTQMADYKSQFQWFLAIAFLLLFVDVFFLERKTSWIKKMNLFNEKKS